VIKILEVLKYCPRRLQSSFFTGILLVSFSLSIYSAHAQVVVNGKVYETGTEITLQGASVINKTTQKGELTDRYGYFSVDGKVGDTIEIRLIGYVPKTFAIPPGSKIIVQNVFLTIKKFQLQNVQVLARPDFKRDSLLNRQENAAIFNYKKPTVLNATLNTIFHPLSGVDNLIHNQKRKRLRNFQDKLETQEQDRYIDSRYSRQLVSGLTGLQGEELETFMKLYRPSFEDLQSYTEYDLYSRVKEDHKDYEAYKANNKTPNPKAQN